MVVVVDGVPAGVCIGGFLWGVVAFFQSKVRVIPTFKDVIKM